MIICTQETNIEHSVSLPDSHHFTHGIFLSPRPSVHKSFGTIHRPLPLLQLMLTVTVSGTLPALANDAQYAAAVYLKPTTTGDYGMDYSSSSAPPVMDGLVD